MPFKNTNKAIFLCIFPSVLLLTPLCCKHPAYCSVFSFRGFRVFCSVYKAFGSRQNGWHGSVPPIYCLTVFFPPTPLFLYILLSSHLCILYTVLRGVPFSATVFIKHGVPAACAPSLGVDRPTSNTS